jgi:hypothetical protein
VARIMSAGAGALSATFLVRELDLRQTWVPSSTAELFHEGDGKDVLILSIGASFVALVLLHWRSVMPALRALLRPRAAAYIIPGILLVIAGLFERLEKHYGAKLWVAFEETTELNGYALLLLAGWFLPFHDLPSAAVGHASERGSGG